MDRFLRETTGFSVLRPIAESKLKNEADKQKVWSDFYEAWGLFSLNATMYDEFLLWCSIKVGDRITLDPPEAIKNFYVVVDIERDQEIRESPMLIFKLLGPNCSILDIKVKEKSLFQEAIKYF